MSISKLIKSEHILQAITEMDLVGVENFNLSTKYDLLYNGKHYPPKEVLQIASKTATGQKIRRLSGGDQTNNDLIKLGFNVVLKGTNYRIEKDYVKKQKKDVGINNSRHSWSILSSRAAFKEIDKRDFLNLGIDIPEDIRVFLELTI